MVTSTETIIRPLQDDDVVEAEEMAYAALAEVGEHFGFSITPRDDARIAWARARVRHIAAHDPGGSVIAEQDGRIVGIGLAIKRGSLWFLSLLAVRQGLQGVGVGRQLMDATLAYGEGCTRAMICASPDPKALRRYARAGFALHAGYEATGRPDRAELPADLGVRDGDWARDADLAQGLIKERRGEPYGPDLLWLRDQDAQLLVRDGRTPSDRAIATNINGRVGVVAAGSDDAAARVLCATIAGAEGDVSVSYLTGVQQWAIEVAIAARLRLNLTETLCTRGDITPPAPYLPSGLFG
jgi:predicted N-acetyltransferase YhbS